MEPTSFAVGLSGLVGLFTSCLDLVQRYDTYKTASRDQRSLDVQLQGAVYRLKHWGNNVGIKEGKLSDTHHPALDNPDTIKLVNGLLGSIKEFLGSSDDPKSPSSIKKVPSFGIDGQQSSEIAKVPRLERAAWALRGRSKQNNHVQSLEPLVSLLYDIVPPDNVKPISRTNSLVHGNDTTIGSNKASNSTTPFYMEELRVVTQRLKEESKGPASIPGHRPLLTSIARMLQDVGFWLGSPSPNDIYHDSSEKRLEETCEWILHRDKFLEWQAPTTTAKALWINGPAGFGKTVLCAKLVQEVKRTTAGLMAYFFLSTKFEGRENPFLAMRSWLTSLVLKSQVAFEIVSKRRLSQHEQRAPQSTIIQLFGEVTIAIPGCTFILDGLDECTGMADTDNKSVSHFLNDLRKSIYNTNTRLLVVSRPAAIIQQGLSLFPGYSVYNIELDDVGPDLIAFASDVVERKLALKDEPWKFLVVQKIKDRCEGQFQWIKLQESSLRRRISKTHLERVIDQTPSGLDALYDREWNRINSMGPLDRQRALSLLRWTVFAMRPMTVGEIAEAVLITEDSDELPVDERPECIDDDYIESMILDLCGSLLEVKQPAKYNRNGVTSSFSNGANDYALNDHDKQLKSGAHAEDQEVHLTHFSVKEYILLKFTPAEDLLPHARLRSSVESREHMALAKCCVRYITFKGAWDDRPEYYDMPHKTGFLYYATTKWPHHYKLVGTPDSALKDDVWALFDTGKQLWPKWSSFLRWGASPWEIEGEWKPHSAIHVAASLNLTHVVERLLQEGKVDTNYRAGLGNTVLHQACSNGYKDFSTQLFKSGADYDTESLSKHPAAQLASEFQQREMITLLIERGADVHSRNQFDLTPLHYASGTGNTHLARLLLDRGADPRSKGAAGYTPLFNAITGNHIAMVQLLLDRGASQGADVNAARDELSETLCEACELGSLELVQSLVNRGANVNCRVSQGDVPTSLYSAIKGGRLEIVTFLLDEGCSTEEVYVGLEKPLHLASVIGNTQIAHLLLERGADVEARNNCGRQPIHLASYAGYVSTIKLLMENGADAKAVDCMGRTPLSYASEVGHKSVVQLLLSTSSDDLKVADCYGRNPLHYACQEGRAVIVKFLIKSGKETALLDQRDCWGSTPLSMAVRRGHFDVVRFLMATELVELKSKDDLGRSLVWWARRQHQLAILSRLVGPGGDLSFGRDQDSCLEEPKTLDTRCDICCFSVSETPFHTCDICMGSSTTLDICSECFTRGGHCFDTGHKLLVQDCD